MDLRRPAPRRVALAGLALLLAAGTTACSNGVGKPAAAATVNGTEITQDEVVALTAATKRFYEFSIEQGQDSTGELSTIVEGMSGTGTETVGLESANEVLTGMIQDEVMRQELADHDALPSKDDRDALEQDLKDQFAQQGGEIKYADLDDEYMAHYIDQTTLTEAYQKWLASEADKGAEAPDPAELEQQRQDYYEQLKPTIPLCLNAILVNSEADATAALARVQGGETFGDVAKEVSLEPTSAANGGFAGCESYDVASQAFSLDFTGAKVGDLYGPAPYYTQQGADPQYVVIEVAGIEGPTYEQAQARVEEAVPETPVATDPTSIDWQTPLAKLMRSADIDVDRRFGSWNDETLVVDGPPSPPGASTTTSTTIPILTADTSGTSDGAGATDGSGTTGTTGG